MQASRHLSAELLQAARAAGIDICVIDPARPLEEQHGHPYSAILHKIRGDAGAAGTSQFNLQLQDTALHYPQCASAAVMTMFCGAASGFEAAVQRYQAAHGNIPVVDDFDAVRPLTRRDTMLQVLADGLRLRAPSGNPDVADITCLAPPQIVHSPGEPLASLRQNGVANDSALYCQCATAMPSHAHLVLWMQA